MLILLILCFWFGQGQERAAESQSPANGQQQAAPSVPSPIPQLNAGQSGNERQQHQSDTAQWSDPLVLLQLFILIAIAVQAGIYGWQLWVMKDGLRETRNLVKHNSDMVEAMQEQLAAIERQADIMAGQKEIMKLQTEAMVGQIRVMGESVLETRKLVAQNENMVTAMQGQLDAIKSQNETLKESIAIGEQSSIYAQRAYVVAKIRGVSEDSTKLQFRLRIVNAGNTPANDVHVSYNYGLREEPPHKETDEKFVGSEENIVVYDVGFPLHERLGLIAPKSSYHVIETPKHPQMSGPEFNKWKLGGIKFYCWGRIVYEDIFNRKWRTDFCFLQSQEHPKGYPCKHGNHAM